MKKIFITLFLLSLIIPKINAQSSAESARYYQSIYDIFREIQVKELNYLKAVIYKKRQTRVDHKKNKVDEASIEAVQKLKALPPFDGDSTLRDVTVKVLEERLKIMEIEMPHLDDISQNAYESYEALENYYAETNRVIALLDSIDYELVAAQESFAYSNGFSLSEDNTRLSKQLKTISELETYMQPIYLAVFKVEKEVAGYSDALNKMDYEKAEEFRESIIETSKESIRKLTSDKGYNGDKLYSSQAGQLLRFYQKEAKTTFIRINSYVKKGNNMSRPEAKEFNELIKSFQKRYSDAIGRYQNGFDNFRQRFVSRW